MADKVNSMVKPGAQEAKQDEPWCKCGIPNCQGHDVINGKIRVNGHPLAKTVTPRPELMKLYAKMLLERLKEDSGKA
jgi:hypothetical protein